MKKVKNVSRGPRTFQVREGKNGPVTTVILGPGEERDLNLASPDEGEDLVLKGMVDSGQVVIGGGDGKEVDQEQRFANDPKFVSDRQAAEAAAAAYAEAPAEVEKRASADTRAEADTGKKYNRR